MRAWREEQGAFDFDDVVAAICDKMRAPASACVRRRGGRAMPQAQTRRTGKQHKRARARRRAATTTRSALAGIARGLPEWQRAVKLQQRAARVGFDWPGPGRR